MVWMTCVKFKWKSQEELPDDNPERHFEYFGFKAENVRNIFQELVYDEGEKDGIPLQINYSKILPICVNTIKELKTKNDELQQKLTTIMVFLSSKSLTKCKYNAIQKMISS